MIDKKMEKSLNSQINAELYSASAFSRRQPRDKEIDDGCYF